MKPILFNTDMVRAILDGRKTVTRRVVKGVENDWEFLQTEWNPAMTKVDRNGEEYPQEVEGFWATFEWDGLPEFPLIKAKYKPGDILYVRETWGTAFNTTGRTVGKFVYLADGDPLAPMLSMRWYPSIHMPRRAARLFLRVTDVRVERLQDVDEKTAMAEGACSTRGFIVSPENEYAPPPHTAVEDFRRIWDSTIKPKNRDLYGWEANPWVWVIEFERITKEEAMKT